MRILSKILEPKTNSAEITWMITRLLNVKLSITTIRRELEEHPDHPSLLSVSDVLRNYGVDNFGIKIDKSDFSATPVPFITQIRGLEMSMDFFTVVRSVDQHNIDFFDPEAHRWKTVEITSFLARCSGVLLLVEPGENAGETDYYKNRKQEIQRNLKQNFITLAAPLTLTLLALSGFRQFGLKAILPFLFSLVTLIGAAVSALLVYYEIDQFNPLIKKICSFGKKVNCSAILQSKAARIAGISWSVIGFTYFGGLFYLQLLKGIFSPETLVLNAWLNLLACPYVFFSIYYQWRVARQWCLMCLAVQSALLAQLLIAFAGQWHTDFESAYSTSSLILDSGFIFILVLIMTDFLVGVLKNAKKGEQFSMELQRLKHHPAIFEALLLKQKTVPEIPSDLGISLGNPGARFKLVKVCNPYCGPCAQVHDALTGLLQSNPDLQLQILFTTSNNQADIALSPSSHLLAIAEHEDEQLTRTALHDWYAAEIKDYKKFAIKYPLKENLKLQHKQIEAMRTWCDATQIEFTPTFFINQSSGDRSDDKFYQLPELYTINDLKYMFTEN